jgi:hypothetical protein
MFDMLTFVTGFVFGAAFVGLWWWWIDHKARAQAVVAAALKEVIKK